MALPKKEREEASVTYVIEKSRISIRLIPPYRIAETFSEVEKLFYKRSYDEFVDNQNERNAKTRHTERNRSIDDLLQSKKTCPEETVFQIGTLDDHASPEVLLQVVTDFITEMDRRFGSHIHTLDWALHLDESTPHIHERHVFDCENKSERFF